MLKFNVTYEIITNESAENGEVESDGFVGQDMSLRDALNVVTDSNTRHCGISSVEASDSRIDQAQWFTVYNNPDLYTGEYENRSLHIPDSVTPSSRMRIARALGVRC